MSLNWQPDLDSFRTSVYTPAEPLLEKRLGVSATSMELTREAQKDMEVRVRAEGYLPINECPEDVQEHWAKVYVEWLTLDILRHLSERP